MTAMRINVAATEMREMMDGARDREVMTRMCFFGAGGPEAFGSAFCFRIDIGSYGFCLS